MIRDAPKAPTMEYVPACELGRESLNSVSAGVLATVLRELVARYQQSRRAVLQLYDTQILCTDNLEIKRRKYRKVGEDEGFESDDDARSSTSSCCLVDDHVFKEKKDSDTADRASPSSNSNVGSTDSANSSGSSDTDDTELHTPSPIGRLESEIYPICDVIFCHTEPRYPNTIAWVIKKKTSYFDTSSRLGKTGVERSNNNCLDVIVIKCKASDGFKNLCNSYREQSRRFKLDHYKSVNRRKPIVLSTLTDTKDIKVSLSEMKVGRSSLLKASELSILNPKIMTSFKSDLKNSVSLNSLLKPEAGPSETKAPGREDTMKKSSSLSNISPSRFNLLQRTDTDGMTHIEVSKPKSKIQKEIEGVILTNVESCIKKDTIRQRQSPSVLSESRLWRPDDSVSSATPPLRPERRKFIRKKMAPPPPQQNTIYTNLPNLPDAKSKSKFYLPIQDEEVAKKTGNSEYNRVNWTDQQTTTLGNWKNSLAKESGLRLSRKSEDKFVDRRRSRSVGRKAPMAYRYIDITQTPVVAMMQVENTTMRRRRNSFDDIINHKSNLKSVIKSSKKIASKFNEPKKVTFSAYATVQVVD